MKIFRLFILAFCCMTTLTIVYRFFTGMPLDAGQLFPYEMLFVASGCGLYVLNYLITVIDGGRP